MNILCWMFGHKPPVYGRKGWWSPGEEYGRIVLDVVDGTGRQHAHVYGKCARCDKNFRVARVHLPDRGDSRGGETTP